MAKYSLKEDYCPLNTRINEELTIKYYQGATPKELAKHFNRTVGSIISRGKKLELVDFDR